MYCFSQFCYCCLKKRKFLISINNVDVDKVSYEDKLKFCYLQTDNITDEFPKLLCQKCCKDINFMYKFRKLYLKRREDLQGYVKILTKSNCELPSKYIKLSVDILNANILLNNFEQTYNIKGTSFDITTKNDNVLIKREIEDENKNGEDLFDINVQTVNFTLHNPFTNQKETEIESNLRHIEEDIENLSQTSSINTIHNYEIVKNGEEKEENKHLGDVSSGLKIVIRKRSLICNICNKSFSSKHDLNLHLSTHDNRTKYTCIFCTNTFVNFTTYMKHERCHPNQPYNCKICNKFIAGKQFYRIHMGQHTGHYKYKCNICFKGLSSNKNLINHYLTRHKRRNNFKLTDHKTKHSHDINTTDSKLPSTNSELKISPKPNESQLTFSDKFPSGRFEAKITHNIDEFRKTLIMVNKKSGTGRVGRPKKPKNKPSHEKLFYCEKCSQSFANKTCLTKHNFCFHTLHKCQTCFKQFKSKYLLSLHKKQNLNCKLVVSINNNRMFNCEVCNRSFKLNIQLKHHRKTHVEEIDGETSLPGKETNHNSESNNSFKECIHCNKTFLNKVQLDLHLLVHTGVHKFKCKYCPRKFSTKIYLQNHVNRMHKTTLHKCNFCIKSFKLRHNLNRHMIVFHVKESVKHSCDFCSKSFLKLTHLRRHIKSHNYWEKIYPCSECNKIFYHKANLIRHLVIHTQEQSYQCDICERKFNLVQNMLKHKKVHA